MEGTGKVHPYMKMARIGSWKTLLSAAALLAVVTVTVAAWRPWVPRLDAPVTEFAANAPVLPAPERGLRIFHLGHSLVGRDMPAMLQQLAVAAGIADHRYESQLGWGTSLRAHWYPDVPIGGYARENAHERFRPAHEAIASGDYDAVILTEMVELRDAILWHDSPRYFVEWTRAAQTARPDVRVYMYKTWHDLEHPDGWLERLQRDPAELWIGQILAHAWETPGLGPVHVIPAAQVLAGLTQRLDDEGGVDGLREPADLFARNPDGTLDTIHMNDQGSYLIALVHFATLYQRDPRGLPHRLLRADGTPADAPTEGAAALMQDVVWEMLSRTPHTGLRPTNDP